MQISCTCTVSTCQVESHFQNVSFCQAFRELTLANENLERDVHGLESLGDEYTSCTMAVSMSSKLVITALRTRVTRTVELIELFFLVLCYSR